MQEFLSRRTLLARGALALAGVAGFTRWRATGTGKTAMLVYKDPGCGCCEAWVGLMQGAGFVVSARNTSDMDAIKRRYHIPPALVSCHTAVVEGYLIEGHVPADLIEKLLHDKPALAGLAVPGMVTGSPGMEGPNPQPYQVLGFDAAGKTSVYARR